jgi:DNA-binding XRE family transcriptional regulator
MHPTTPPILVFRSARPGWSFETWLFQRLTPRDRRALTAAITVYGRHWTSEAALPGSPRRRGLHLREAMVHLGPRWPLRVFCLPAATGPVVLAAGGRCARGPGVQRDPALGRARRLAREVQNAQQRGDLSRILCLDSFEAIRAQCRVGRTIAWDKDKRAGLVAFEDVKALVLQEAALEGPAAGVEFRQDEVRYRLGVALMLRRAGRGLTQRELASLAGIPQPTISAIERGLANPTLATLAELAHALGCGVGLG